MAKAVRVAVESPLMQLDREFDFLVPKNLESVICFGQRVSFRFGRSKTPQTGFVTELLESSKFATSPIDAVVAQDPVLTMQMLNFSRTVANRQCVALGEILALPYRTICLECQFKGCQARHPRSHLGLSGKLY